jgi:hypothetical protein
VVRMWCECVADAGGGGAPRERDAQGFATFLLRPSAGLFLFLFLFFLLERELVLM